MRFEESMAEAAACKQVDHDQRRHMSLMQKIIRAIKRITARRARCNDPSIPF